ncbi:MAG: hypothetical protein DWQ08_15600 [Proteobacteria bacterium]|nr:MAG: hypothetical protein DWQ08_15600 [Pseudomonadota bacterium]
MRIPVFLLVLFAGTLAPAGDAFGAASCQYTVRPVSVEPLSVNVAADCSGLDADGIRFVSARSRAFADVESSGGGHLRYRFDIDGFVDSIDEFRIAARRGDARMLTLASWLGAPADAGPSTRIAIRWSAADRPVAFASVLPESEDGFEIDVGDLRRAGYTVFGAYARRTIEVAAADGSGQARIAVIDLRQAGPDLSRWIADTATEVGRFYGRFPVANLLLVLLDGEGEGIDYGRVVSGGGATMLLVIGEAASVPGLYGEWVLVHEMLHLGTPFMPRAFWFMEGFATYAEPIIRARAGWRSERSVWNEFYRDMPRGLRALQEEGLSRTRSGMYWGGALFMLLADLEYRRMNGGMRGLEHCMRGVLDELGDSTVSGVVARVVDYCDSYFGAPVMANLSRRYVYDASPFDIASLWQRLGLHGSPGDVRLDDDAADAALRSSIVRQAVGGAVEMNENAPDSRQ